MPKCRETSRECGARCIPKSKRCCKAGECGPKKSKAATKKATATPKAALKKTSTKANKGAASKAKPGKISYKPILDSKGKGLGYEVRLDGSTIGSIVKTGKSGYAGRVGPKGDIILLGKTRKEVAEKMKATVQKPSTPEPAKTKRAAKKTTAKVNRDAPKTKKEFAEVTTRATDWMKERGFTSPQSKLFGHDHIHQAISTITGLTSKDMASAKFLREAKDLGSHLVKDAQLVKSRVGAKVYSKGPSNFEENLAITFEQQGQAAMSSGRKITKADLEGMMKSAWGVQDLPPSIASKWSKSDVTDQQIDDWVKLSAKIGILRRKEDTPEAIWVQELYDERIDRLGKPK